MHRKNPSSYRRALLSLLCIFTAVFLTGAVATTVFFQDFMAAIQAPPEEPLTQQELDRLLAQDKGPTDAPTMQPEEVTFAPPEAQIGGEDSKLINILLIGQDRRPGEERTRSDSMILCTVNPGTKTLTLTSILRDLYVQIPGYADNRINAAYAAGGMPLLDKTLETNFGIHVDGNVEVDFGQFSEIIDLLGGVTLEIRADEAREINRLVWGSSLTAGEQTLNGEQALVYARIRKLDSDSDFSRTNRQRKVLTALIQQHRNLNLSTLTALYQELLPSINTDLTQYQIVSYGLTVLPILKDLKIVSQRIPAEEYYEDRTIRGMSVLIADMEKTRELLKATLGES